MITARFTGVVQGATAKAEGESACSRSRVERPIPRARRIERGRPAILRCGRRCRGVNRRCGVGGAPPHSRPARRAVPLAIRAVHVHDDDLVHVLRAAELSHGSDGLVQPHPRSGCVLLDSAGAVVARTFQMGQGGVRSEVLAAREAGARADGGVAYLNLEPAHGPAVGEDAAVDALVRSRVSRVVVGILHPVAGVRGRAVAGAPRHGRPRGRPRGVHLPVHVRRGRTRRLRRRRGHRAVPRRQPPSPASRRDGQAVQRLQVRHDRRREDRHRPRGTARGHGSRREAAGVGGAREVGRRGRRHHRAARTTRTLTTRRDGGHRPARILSSRERWTCPGRRTRTTAWGPGTSRRTPTRVRWAPRFASESPGPISGKPTRRRPS